MNHPLLIFFTALILAHTITAQESHVVDQDTSDIPDYFEGIHSTLDYDLVEWDVFTHKHDGKLEITWSLSRDMTHWSFEIGEISGTIRQLWKDNDSHYELNTHDGVTVTMRTKWPTDHSEWVIKSENADFIWMATQYDDANEWFVKAEDLGTLMMFTDILDDPRDWLIEDYMPEELVAEKMACFFITLIRVINNFD